MSKFIVHKDALLYTTHGFLSAEHLYNVYKKEGLKKNCCLVGWKPNGEIYGSIYSISAIDSTNSSINKKDELSASTKKKLEALNIDISSVSSETEAKRIIKEEEAKKSEKTEVIVVSTSGSQEEKLFERIKNLARKLGINVSKNENIETIFVKIEERLKELEENSNNSNINVLRSELEILKNEFKNITTGESSILSAMDLLAQSTRAELGI